jgi:hypothetical protein
MNTSDLAWNQLSQSYLELLTDGFYDPSDLGIKGKNVDCGLG